MSQTVKGSPEFDATVGKFPMFTYYVPGCCAMRAFHGLDGKHSYGIDPSTRRYVSKYDRPTPQQIVEGIVKSGCGGSTMIFTDAKNKGAAIKEFAEFIEKNGLGVITISPGKANYYTSAMVFTGVFEYDIDALASWVKENVESMKGWSRPDGWTSTNDAVNMDAVFYNYGGRPKASNADTDDAEDNENDEEAA